MVLEGGGPLHPRASSPRSIPLHAVFLRAGKSVLHARFKSPSPCRQNASRSSGESGSNCRSICSAAIRFISTQSNFLFFMLYDLQRRVDRNRPVPLQGVYRIEQRNLLIIDDVLEIPAHDHFAAPYRCQGYVQGIIVGILADDSCIDIRLLKHKRFFGYGSKMSQRQQIPEVTIDGFRGELQFPANNLGDEKDELANSNSGEKCFTRIGEFVVFDTAVDRSICINEEWGSLFHFRSIPPPPETTKGKPITRFPFCCNEWWAM